MMGGAQLIIWLCVAALATASSEPVDAATRKTVSSTQPDQGIQSPQNRNQNDSKQDTRQLYYGSDDYTYYEDADDSFCCLERATSCEPLGSGYAETYDPHYAGGSSEEGPYTVCRSYCAVPCDDDDGYGWPFFPGPHMCFPTVTSSDGCDCDCTCCGLIRPPMYDEPSSSSYYYASKAGMKGRKGGYYSRRTEEETRSADQQNERALPGKGFGGGYGHHGMVMPMPTPGPPLSCRCDCDCDGSSSYYYGSKAGMKGRKGAYSSYY